MPGGSNAARFAFINSSGLARSHWGKVYAIQKNRENATSHQTAPTPTFTPSISNYHPRLPRKIYSAGSDLTCIHCRKNLEAHTKVKKFCPKSK
jgi:hypothetical protein